MLSIDRKKSSYIFDRRSTREIDTNRNVVDLSKKSSYIFHRRSTCESDTYRNRQMSIDRKKSSYYILNLYVRLVRSTQIEMLSFDR
jgi:hypothetical protein